MRAKAKHIHKGLAKYKHIEMHLADNCNLDCASCSHFSSIVDKEDGKWRADVEQTERDFKRMSELFYEHTSGSHIWLMGGEPLLHPQVSEFFRIARENFPGKDRHVWLLTNGILLLSQKDEFWHAAKKYDIKIKMSHYPPVKTVEKIKAVCAKWGIPFKLKLKPDFREQLLNLDGPYDMQKNYDICGLSSCVNLRHGKMYTCCMLPHIHFFNKKFNKDLPNTGPALDPGGGIDLYADGLTDVELANKLDTPVDLCKFCVADPKKSAWKRTKGEIAEWVVNSTE